MTLPITPVPAYPNVPNAPGVPPVLQQVGAVQSTVVALVSDVATVLSLFQGPQWGLFNADGSAVFGGPTTSSLLNNLASGIGLSSQSVLEMEFSQDYAISTAPQEQGAFVSYNKVGRPYTAKVTYAVGGLAATRTAFLQAAQTLIASLALLTLVTPEITYANCNAVHYDYRRMQRAGVTLLVVDIWVEEVRVTAAAAFSNSNTATPDAADQSNGGTVQPQPLTSSQTSSLPAGDVSQDGAGTPGGTGQAAAEAPSGTGGDGNTTVGVESEPYYDANGNQIGIAPSTTPADGPVVGSYSNGQPVIGGSWQNGFYDLNNNWVHP